MYFYWRSVHDFPDLIANNSIMSFSGRLLQMEIEKKYRLAREISHPFCTTFCAWKKTWRIINQVRLCPHNIWQSGFDIAFHNCVGKGSNLLFWREVYPYFLTIWPDFCGNASLHLALFGKKWLNCNKHKTVILRAKTM